MIGQREMLTHAGFWLGEITHARVGFNIQRYVNRRRVQFFLIGSGGVVVLLMT